MESLYLPEFDGFVRWHSVGRGGVPVCFLPAISIPAVANFLPTATHPALENRRAHMVDYLGVGASDAPEAFSYALEDHARIVARVLDRLGQGPYAVVGHSMGGTVGILLAEARPDLVALLQVAEGNVAPGGGTTTSAVAAFDPEAFARNGRDAFVAPIRDRAKSGGRVSGIRAAGWSAIDPRIGHMHATALVNVGNDLLDRFLGLPMPRSFVYGERTYPPNAGGVTPDTPDPEGLVAAGVRVGVVPGTGHAMMIRDPDAYMPELLTDLGRI